LLLGTLLGTLIGVLPGLGPAATIAMLLPVTFTLEPTTALIMLSGIYYGAQYGGSTTAILVNLPGEASSVVTVLDAYQMARQGRAGAALATAALGSLFAGCVATLLIAFAAPGLGALAMQFHAADYFSLMVLGLIAFVALAQGSLLKALAMIVLGLITGIIGTDVTSGAYRMTFGLPGLLDSVSILLVAMGMFGLGEIIQNLASPEEKRTAITAKLTKLLPSREEFRRIVAPVLRGTALGSVLGLLPGGGALLPSFAAYAIEKRVSKHPELRARRHRGAGSQSSRRKRKPIRHDHQIDIEARRVEREGADCTAGQDRGEQIFVGHGQQLDRDADERKVEDHQHQIADLHRHDQAPE
jgi:putative tricarboxylic transport membrane protein